MHDTKMCVSVIMNLIIRFGMFHIVRCAIYLKIEIVACRIACYKHIA